MSTKILRKSQQTRSELVQLRGAYSSQWWS